VARNVLGAFVTPEQEASFLAQMGLDTPIHLRYLYWLVGSDWHASRKVGLPLRRVTTRKGFVEWWAVREDGVLVRWKLQGEDLIAEAKTVDGTLNEYKDNERWRTTAEVQAIFWGVDNQNHVVKWGKGTDRKVWTFVMGTGWMESSGGPVDYIPLKKGFVRGDPGVSLRTGRPVAKSLYIRVRNSMVLAGIALVLVMPLALLLGMLAGLKEGSLRDRLLSIGGMVFTVIPEFATGIFLILIVAVWLGLVPGATVFGEKAPWERPDMLVLPVLTLALIELGYVLRITRASMVEVMRSPYIRTAFLKGLPYWRIVFKHAIRNALMAPITVIMLHVNWLMGGIVIVEVVFGYPGLGKYLLESALFKDINALEAGAMVLVIVAVGTQLLADIIYTFLNPRIRYT
jgi:peptide/nickel transport system permease protein